MNRVFGFLGSNFGRFVRFAAGGILISIGYWLLSGFWSWVLIIIGFVPLLAGVFDFCVFAPLVGLPFRGEPLRRSLRPPQE